MNLLELVKRKVDEEERRVAGEQIRINLANSRPTIERRSDNLCYKENCPHRIGATSGLVVTSAHTGYDVQTMTVNGVPPEDCIIRDEDGGFIGYDVDRHKELMQKEQGHGK
jgi:hypothetical protein